MPFNISFSSYLPTSFLYMSFYTFTHRVFYTRLFLYIMPYNPKNTTLTVYKPAPLNKNPHNFPHNFSFYFEPKNKPLQI